MENAELTPVVEPGIIPQTGPIELPQWSKWVDSKAKLWIVVGRSDYQTIEGRYTATQIHCLDVASEYVQLFHVLDLWHAIRTDRLTRLTGHIIPEAITQ